MIRMARRGHLSVRVAEASLCNRRWPAYANAPSIASRRRVRAQTAAMALPCRKSSNSNNCTTSILWVPRCMMVTHLCRTIQQECSFTSYYICKAIS